MNTLGAYRGLKRLTTAATFLLFAVSLIVGFVYLDKADGLWAIAMWSGVCAPVAATLLILALLGLGWRAPGLNASAAPYRLRAPTALWLFIGIQIPWILAWLGADAAGNWWRHLHAGSQSTAYLGAVRLFAWLAGYSLASALGVFATILIDMRFSSSQTKTFD